MLTCAKCGSERIMPDVQILDQGQMSDGTLNVVIHTKPQAMLFRGAVLQELRAHICGDCGYVELRAVEPAKLYKAWLKSIGRP